MKHWMKQIAILCLCLLVAGFFTACNQNTQGGGDSQDPSQNPNQGENQNPPDGEDQEPGGDEQPDDPEAVEKSYQLADFLGKDDKAVQEAKGSEGQAGTVEIDGQEYLLSRIYNEKFFGFDAEVTYTYQDNQQVGQISALYVEGSLQEIIDRMTEKLGEPFSVNQGGDNYVLKAVWKTDEITYQLVYNGLLINASIKPTEAQES